MISDAATRTAQGPRAFGSSDGCPDSVRAHLHTRAFLALLLLLGFSLLALLSLELQSLALRDASCSRAHVNSLSRAMRGARPLQYL